MPFAKVLKYQKDKLEEEFLAAKMSTFQQCQLECFGLCECPGKDTMLKGQSMKLGFAEDMK